MLAAGLSLRKRTSSCGEIARCALFTLIVISVAAPDARARRKAATPKLDKRLRIAIVLDDSGSMQHNDPRRLSVTAAMIAVQLAARADKVALVPLNGRRTSLRPAGSAAAPLLRQLRGLDRRGVRTVYDEPLRRAIDLLQRVQGERLVLFLTDGAPDGGPSVDRARFARRQERFLDRLGTRPPKGIRFYPLMLGKLAPRWAGRLRAMAHTSGGRAFNVDGAERVIEIFSSIHAALLGSKVVTRNLAAGRTKLARFDDFVRFANLVIVSKAGPFRVRYPGLRGGGKALDSGADRRRDGKKPARIYHYVDRLPPRGELSVELSGASTYRALLIWDYDLAVVMDKPIRKADGGYALSARLERKSAPGVPVDKEAFLRASGKYESGTKVYARVCAKRCAQRLGERCRIKRALKLSCVAGRSPRCRFEGRFTPPRPGNYCVDAIAMRRWAGHDVLELTSRQRHPIAVSQQATLDLGTEHVRLRIDQNEPKSKSFKKGQWRHCQPVELRATGLIREEKLKLDLSALKLPKGLTLEVNDGTMPSLSPRRSRRQLAVCLTAKGYRDGFETKNKKVIISASDGTFFAGKGKTASFTVDTQLVPATFWKRYKRLLIILGSALLALLLLLWLIIGFMRPHAFPDNLQVCWGQKIERLERNSMPVSEVPGSSRGFYRNAQLWIGGRKCFLQSGWPARARFEATSRRGISLIADSSDVSLERINKFDNDKRDSLSSGAGVSVGDIYKINDLYLRLKL